MFLTLSRITTYWDKAKFQAKVPLNVFLSWCLKLVFYTCVD